MKLIIDTREQNELTFVSVVGVEVCRETMNVGDYTARHSDGSMDTTVIERKSVSDLYGSFTANYDAERAKILRAKDQGLKYVLGIEASILDVRKGHSYWNGEEMVTAKKDGLSMVKQLMTIARKYHVEIHYFNGPKEMAFWTMQYFLARDRALEKPSPS
jgi:hypothetical protein